LLIVLTRGDGDETDPVSVDQKPDIELKVDAPVQGDRVEIGSDVEVLVRGSATEDLVRFELYREVEGDPVLADTVSVSEPSPQGVYSSTLKIRFEDVGEYSFFVRVVTESGAFRDSASVGVVAYKRVMDVQEAVKGRAIALVTLRAGPGDQFAAAGRLQPGDEVDILGKTRDLEWLLLDRGTGVWVRQAAIEELDSLALVPVSEPTPTPLPATSTPEPSPTGSVTPTLTATPTLSPSAPDFIPANASLFDGGEVIQVTIANISPNAFAGALVVSVSGLSSGTIELVFSVDIPANGTEMVALPLSTAITEPTTVEVTVDPQNAIPEANEDNNRVQFQGLVPPEIVPELTITGVAVDSEFVRVTVINRGGPLPESTVSVRVTVGQQFAAEVRETSLGSGESQEFTITNPGPGTALIEILVDDLVATSVDDIELP
ncbi:MAG TPA: CARDB domain-containing protein, partial [Dehalococcoidia bacterium]|nr:CARDB domain-containing protein [Dehalococcoidia bacterium]